MKKFILSFVATGIAVLMGIFPIATQAQTLENVIAHEKVPVITATDVATSHFYVPVGIGLNEYAWTTYTEYIDVDGALVREYFDAKNRQVSIRVMYPKDDSFRSLSIAPRSSFSISSSIVVHVASGMSVFDFAGTFHITHDVMIHGSTAMVTSWSLNRGAGDSWRILMLRVGRGTTQQDSNRTWASFEADQRPLEMKNVTWTVSSAGRVSHTYWRGHPSWFHPNVGEYSQ